MPQIVVAQLNAQLRPMDRGEYFEDPLDAILAEHGVARFVGAVRWCQRLVRCCTAMWRSS